ncbi:MAG: fumarylacetoacetate hydrolase family protein [Solirubrobacterales bacterium]
MADQPLGIGTFLAADGEQEFPGLVLAGERVVDLRPQGWHSTRQMADDWDEVLPRLEELAAADPEAHPLGDLRVLPPIAPDQVLQSGANYRRHVIDLILAEERLNGRYTEAEAREMGERIMTERAENGEPYLFFGTATAMCGPVDDVVLPTDGTQHDWELELAAVIGRPGRDIPVEEALDHVAGYTIVNDITTRDRVYRPDLEAIGTDWLRAKNAPTFLPTGPWIVPAKFISDPMSLTITLRLNGETMQDAVTEDMIFDLPTLISYASRKLVLRPGDLLCTGSPAGNGMYHDRFLTAGDVMESEITGLGRQRNMCVAGGVLSTT